MTAPPRIILHGATGRTGRAVAGALAARGDVDLAWLVARRPDGLAADPALASCRVVSTPEGVEEGPGAVFVDFALAEGIEGRLEHALQRGWHVLVGTTGLPAGLLEDLAPRAEASGLGLLEAANFSLGAVLGMRLAREVARQFADIEIVETHAPHKLDAPSGTARATAAGIARVRESMGVTASADEGQDRPRARGMVVDGVPIHSIRSEGSVAHQQVLAGGPGEQLSIRHDVLDRSCYAAGVALAARRIHDHPGLVVGLEELL